MIVVLTFFVGAAAELYRPATGALIGDLVPAEQRVTAFGLYRFAVNLGFAIGPAMAGFLADKSGCRLSVVDVGWSAIRRVVATDNRLPTTDNRSFCSPRRASRGSSFRFTRRSRCM